MHDGSIFIGYRSQDGLWAHQLHERLATRGVEAFLDAHSILPGQRWSREFERRLGAASVFVALLSGEPAASDGPGDGHYFDHEVQTAIERYRRFGWPIVVPVYVGLARPPVELPYGLRSFQGLFLEEDRWSKVIDPLVALVGGRPTDAPQTLDEQLERLRLRLAHAYASRSDVAELEEKLRAHLSASATGDALQPGRLVDDRYQLLEQTACDSLCSTWRALDIYLAEFVSLRLYTAERLQDRRAAEWSARSAERWARLRHPGIARLRDKLRFEPDTDLGYLSLEAGSSTLRRAIDSGRITAIELIDVLRPLAEALELAAEGNIGHLRVNPETIMLTADGRPKLTGFSPHATDREAVMHQISANELHYMAPEVVWMAEGSLTPRVDQYALAMVAITILHGESLDVRVVRDIAGFVRGLADCGPQARACLLRALDTDPERRFPDCVAFVDALEQARASDDFDDIGEMLVSDLENSRLIETQLRRLRCAGLPRHLVESIPEDPRPFGALELEISELRRSVDPTSMDPNGAFLPWRSSAFAQWLRNIRLMLCSPSPLMRKLDSALLVLDAHRPERPLCRQLDHRFGRVLDLLLAHEPINALDALRASLASTRSALLSHDDPRLCVFSDFVALAEAAASEEGRTLLGRWLDCLVGRVPSMTDWVEDTRAALIDSRARRELASAISAESSLTRSDLPAIVDAVLSLAPYGRVRGQLLAGLPRAVISRLPLLRSNWEQALSDATSLEGIAGGLRLWLDNALVVAESKGDLGWGRDVSRRVRAVVEASGRDSLLDDLGPDLSASAFASNAGSEGWSPGSQYWLHAVTEAISSLFGADYHQRRLLTLDGISPWAVGWLPQAQSTFEQVSLDGITLLQLGGGRGRYMTHWLANILACFPMSEADEISIVRYALGQLEQRADVDTYWQAGVRPPETFHVERPLQAAGLGDVFECAVEDGLFDQLDRIQLLLDVPRRTHAELLLVSRPIEQMRSDLLGLASRLANASVEPLAAWLTRAERLARGPDAATVYSRARRRLLRLPL